MTTVTEAVNRRISTRAFLRTPVSRSQLETLLSTAQRSPSGGNTQPWRTIVLAGDARQAVIDLATPIAFSNPQGEPTDRPIYPDNLWEPHRSRRFRVGEMMYEKLGIPREDKAARLGWFANNLQFFGAPVALFFVIDERMGHGQWAHMGMFMQTLALLAEEAGLATCMQEFWAMFRPSLKGHFGLAETEMVYCAMALGHADPDHPVNTLYTERAPQDEVVSWHGFS